MKKFLNFNTLLILLLLGSIFILYNKFIKKDVIFKQKENTEIKTDKESYLKNLNTIKINSNDILSKGGYFNFVDKTPINNKNHINKNIQPLKYIVFHTTGDYSCSHGFNSTKDSYEANRKFFRNYADTVKRTASWHFTVDDTGISQLIPLNERGYHASNKEINDSSIGIEMCVNHYKDYEIFRKTLKNEKLLIKEILKLYPKLQLIRHHDADEKNHKNCPEIFTDEQWKVIYDFLINDKEISDDFLKNYTKLKIEYKNGKDTKI